MKGAAQVAPFGILEAGLNKRMIAPVLIGLIGASILLSLGVWQSNRLVWKEAMLARIEAEISADPVPFSEIRDTEEAQFRAVRLSGQYASGELHVLTSTRDVGAVYRVISPFVTEDGRRVLIDRGLLPTSKKDETRPVGEAVLIGNIRTPDDVDSFTPAPDLAKNIWYARDLSAMAAQLDTEQVMIILRETSEEGGDITPLPVDTAGIPNNHLNYAITWFLFALVWLGMTGYWLWRIRRKVD